MYVAILALFFCLSNALGEKFAQDTDSSSIDGVRFLETLVYPYKTEVCKAIDPVTDYNVTEVINIGASITKSEVRIVFHQFDFRSVA